ncbi:hypothetical protein KAT08_03110 [Candidatus Babeliales bacterium]|nr:hypothetical protein [Candidatus Babeliales bacterium]
MFNQELKTFIKEQFERLKKYYNHDNPKIISLAGAVKLTEEVGELCTEILAQNKLIRKEKLKNHNKKTLEEELVDVLITTLILAHSMDLNLEKTLKEKMKIVAKRYSSA